jgi:dolichyl-phosphate-mannose--protein O-mannosyl transferase
MTIFLGLGAGVKWSSIYFLPAFVPIVFCVMCRRNGADVRIKYPAREIAHDILRRPKSAASKVLYNVKDIPQIMQVIVGSLKLGAVFVGTYVLCWLPWFMTPSAYGRSGSLSPSTVVSEFVQYHIKMLNFHTHLESAHRYSAKAITWFLQLRPTSFYYQTPTDCGAEKCSAAIISLGNPIIWWSGLLAFVILVSVTFWRPNLKRMVVLAPIMAGWLPWVLLYYNRTIFEFYAIIFFPYVALAITTALFYVLIKFKDNHRWIFGVVIFSIVIVFICISVYFYPIWTAQHIPYSHWKAHMWLTSWI